MLTLQAAIKIARENIPKEHVLGNNYGEAQGKYVFFTQDSIGTIPPGGFCWTVDKKTGKCLCEYLEREGNKPWSPIRGYKKLELPK